MHKLNLLLTFLAFPFLLQGQNKSLTLGYSQNGIVFGNSSDCNGIRFNAWDRNVHAVNGINLAVKTDSAITNGISIGLLANLDTINNGIKISGLLNSASSINGVSICGLFNFAGNKFNGLGIAGVVNSADTMNGVFVSWFGVVGGRGPNYIKRINGLTIGGMTVCHKFNGLSIGFMSGTDSVRGMNIGMLRNDSENVKGVQVGMMNRTYGLTGVQFGIWNVVENKRFLRRMPLINFDFRRKGNS